MDKLQAELKSVLNGRTATAEDIPKLVYTRQVVDEMLRYYPPAWLVDYFADLLRLYVVSGFGNHQDDVAQLVQKLGHCQVTLAEALTAHSIATEQLALSRQGRSAWYILGRAQLLSLELIMQMQQFSTTTVGNGQSSLAAA